MEQNMINITEDELRQIVRTTVEEVLTKIGVDHSDPGEMQRDFTHLRDWRKSVDKARDVGFMTALGIIVTGLLGALWLGFTTMVNGR